METKQLTVPHNIIIEDRKNVTISGVTDVESFDEETVVLMTDLGELVIKGFGLHISKIDVVSGDLALEGEIYSAMPTGMETTVKVRVGDFLLTGVVFGGVLYRLGQKVRLDFRGDDVVLFSRRNGRLITQGSLTVQ